MNQLSFVALLSAFVINSVAIAGPEDRDQVCYEAASQVTTVPSEICFDRVKIIELDGQPSIVVDTYRNKKLFQNLEIVSLSRHNEDKLSFKSEAVLSYTCDSSKMFSSKTELLVSGKSDNYGEVSDSGLVIQIRETIYDSCALDTREVQQNVVNYKYAE